MTAMFTLIIEIKNLRGRIVRQANQPRLYVIDLSLTRKPVVRNQKYLKPCVENDNVEPASNADYDTIVGNNVKEKCVISVIRNNQNTRSGRVSKPPNRLK